MLIGIKAIGRRKKVWERERKKYRNYRDLLDQEKKVGYLSGDTFNKS